MVTFLPLHLGKWREAFDWFVGWLARFSFAGSLFELLFGSLFISCWLVDWLVIPLFACSLVGWLTRSFPCLLVCWFIGFVRYLFVVWMVRKFVASHAERIDLASKTKLNLPSSTVFMTYDRKRSLRQVHISLTRFYMIFRLTHFAFSSCSLLLRICHTLKSRAREVRTAARDTLAKIAVSLGAQYFSFVLKELRSSLTRGYQVILVVHVNVELKSLFLLSSCSLFNRLESSVLIYEKSLICDLSSFMSLVSQFTRYWKNWATAWIRGKWIHVYRGWLRWEDALAIFSCLFARLIVYVYFCLLVQLSLLCFVVH